MLSELRKRIVHIFKRLGLIDAGDTLLYDHEQGRRATALLTKQLVESYKTDRNWLYGEPAQNLLDIWEFFELEAAKPTQVPGVLDELEPISIADPKLRQSVESEYGLIF